MRRCECGAEIKTATAKSCRRCSLVRARAARKLIRHGDKWVHRKPPDRVAVLAEAARLPDVLQDFLDDAQP